MRTIFGLACGLACAASGAAFGQGVVQETVVTPAPATAVAVEPVRVSQLMGSTVQLQGANNFGKVEDFVMSPNGGPGYLVVSANGRRVMMPWHAANYNTTQRIVTYGVAPTAVQPFYFENNAWPNVADPAYATRVEKVFPGRRGYREVSAPVVPGAGPVIEQKVRVRRNGTEVIRERVR